MKNQADQVYVSLRILNFIKKFTFLATLCFISCQIQNEIETYGYLSKESPSTLRIMRKKLLKLWLK